MSKECQCRKLENNSSCMYVVLQKGQNGNTSKTWILVSNLKQDLGIMTSSEDLTFVKD